MTSLQLSGLILLLHSVNAFPSLIFAVYAASSAAETKEGAAVRKDLILVPNERRWKKKTHHERATRNARDMRFYIFHVAQMGLETVRPGVFIYFRWIASKFRSGLGR